MTGIGIVLGFLGYAAIVWGINSIEGTPQPPFINQILPFAPVGNTG